MDRPYEIAFTKAFWRAIDELELCRSEITAMSLELMENPFLGRDITGQGGSIHAWDITIKEKGSYRWFYIVDQEHSAVVNVFVVCNPKPSRNRGEDAILMARLVEIAWRILAGG